LEDILPAHRRLPGRPPRPFGDLTAYDVAGVFLATTYRTPWGAAGRRGTLWGPVSHDGASVPRWDTMAHTGVETSDSG